MERTKPEVAARVLVAGIGNLFLGDDAVGCEVVRRLQDLAALPGVRVVDYGIRGMHLTYDLQDAWDLVVLVDAIPGRDHPGWVDVLELRPDEAAPGQLDAHGMDPASVLCAVVAMGGALPRTLLVGIHVADSEEGIGLTDAVAAAVDRAAEAVRVLVHERVPRARDVERVS